MISVIDRLPSTGYTSPVWKSLLLLCLLVTPALAKVPRPQVEIAAIKRIAALYTELGEKALAGRLLALYAQEPSRVEFVRSSPFRPFPDLAGVRNGIVASKNTLLINQDIYLSVKPVSDSQFNQRPFDPNRTLLPYALSVAHEMIHLGQYAPNETPAYENEAWREVERLVQSALKVIEAELQAVLQQPASPNQRKRLEGLLDKLRALRSQCGSLRVDARDRQQQGQVSPELTFGFEAAVVKIDKLMADAKNSQTPTAALSGWVSQRFQTYIPGDNPELRKTMADTDRRLSHKLSLQPGVAKTQFVWGGQALPVHLQVGWATPASLKPGTVSLTLEARDTGSQADGGFLECNPQLFGITPAGSWERIGPNGGRATYAESRKPPTTQTYQFSVPARGAYKELVLNFEVCSNLYRRGMHIFYQWRD